MQVINANLKFNGRLTKRAETQYIVLHHAAASNCSPEDIHSWHLKRGWIGAGYHYLVRKDGTVYSLRPENTVGAHCEGYNSRSIGICCEGNFDVEQMGEKQKTALIELVSSLKKKYLNARIVGHRDLAATNCPGKNYPLAEVKEAAENTWIEKVKNTVLKKGSSGDAVKKLQEALNGFGFSCGAADGVFGAKTEAAVKAFQRKYGLAADGIVGPKTWAKLAEVMR